MFGVVILMIVIAALAMLFLDRRPQNHEWRYCGKA
jgi:hypothetical protein